MATGWAVLSRWLLPGASTVVVLLGACAGVCAIAGITCFDLFYGLNVLNRWLLHRCANQIILFVLLVAVFGYDQLERAAMALLLTHFVFLVLGVVWARPFFSPRKALVGFSELLAPLRFAMALFVANLLLMAMVRGGELLVLWLTGRHADVAFYNIANAVAVAFTSLVGQLTAMLIPSLTAYHLTGEGEKNESVAGLSLKYMTIVAFCFLFGVFAAGPWVVRQVLGEQYTPVVANLKILAFGLVPAGLVNMGMLWAVIQNEAGKAVLVTGSALACFVVSSFVLVPRVGASGVCVAFVVGMSVAGLLTCRKFSLGPALVVARFGRLMAVGLASSLVLLIPSMPIVPVGLLAGTVFVVLLFATGTVSTQEIRHLVHMSLRGQA